MAYSAEQIARVVGAPLANVQATWPHLLAALDWQGINDHPTRVALIATVVVETGITVGGVNMTFLPVAEGGGQAAWYAPYYGRGDIQITLKSNYAEYGPQLSPPLDIVSNPDLMLGQVPSAQFAALFFKQHGIPGMAAAGNWNGVRYAVNGGSNGLSVFLNLVYALLREPEPASVAWTTVATAGMLKQAPNHLCLPALGPKLKPIYLGVGHQVRFAPDPRDPAHRIVAGEWAHITPDGDLKYALPGAHGWFLRNRLQTTYKVPYTAPDA